MNEEVKRLNELLELTYRDIQRLEHRMQRSANSPLSISELHFIESVGLCTDRPCTVSELASQLGITLASVTVAVNKLVGKGMLEKTKSLIDGRSVIITLTREGMRMFRMHRFFHHRMVSDLTDGMSEEEVQVLLRAMEKLDQFFLRSLSDDNHAEKEERP